MALLKNLVPIEARISAVDTNSGRRVSNTLYYRNQFDTLAGYGVDIPGTSDATLEDSIYHKWFDTVNPPMDILPFSYQLLDITLRNITGRAYPSPMASITGVSASLTETSITTATPHGLPNLASVFIAGVSSPTTLNGLWTSILVVNPNEFKISTPPLGVWGGGGTVQRARGSQGFTYENKYTMIHSDIGGLAGVESVPLFSTVSMRRLNQGTGKPFRSRISISPISETHNINGRLTVAALALWTSAGASLINVLSGGGAVDFVPYAVSKSIAFVTATPFTQSGTWAKEVNTYAPQRNLGSMINRKPKLDAIIA